MEKNRRFGPKEKRKETLESERKCKVAVVLTTEEGEAEGGVESEEAMYYLKRRSKRNAAGFDKIRRQGKGNGMRKKI